MTQAARQQTQGKLLQVMQPDTSLRSKALLAGNAREAIMAATKKADEAVQQLSVQFANWMADENERLLKARRDLARNGSSHERLDRLFTASHDIKGQAETYGYPVAGTIAGLLCALMERVPNTMEIPLKVLDQHVDAINAVVRHDVRGDGTEKTNHMISALQQLNDTIIARLAIPNEEE